MIDKHNHAYETINSYIVVSLYSIKLSRYCFRSIIEYHIQFELNKLIGYQTYICYLSSTFY